MEPRLVLVVAVGNVDRIVCSSVVVTSRKCALSWLPTSRTMGCEFTRCESALFLPAVGPLFSVLLHSGAKVAGDYSLFSSVRRALHGVLVALHELLRGELFARVQHAHSRAARGSLD